ncbi:inositol monophosphatase family protein [Fimbriimonas ginsengisoli]|uniref:Inositol monophosphate family protein n=1 Tax=Fimbriimonas ginsengisoli Gsoil 348 TaxID=661478 RepID=A0A068NTW0_FIMGI|nr:inositol monophosphatase family protein [Fimbriimonas ginsengisoli]AIE86876.1 inositol monophosphate family protein [Fimbriimonas ginsengisoli Gsoil 348]
MPISTRLADLGSIVERAGALAQEMRGTSIARELKGDGTIVTAADRAVEQLLRQELTRLIPNTTVWGEEFGFDQPGTAGLWVVDPIDGTSNFGFGSPLWGVSVALVRGDEILIGAVTLPDLRETYLAEQGQGAYRSGVRLPDIEPGPVRPEELVSYSDGFIRKAPDAKLPGKMRLAGAFVIDGTFTACQRYRGLLGYKERLYDIGACVLMGQELGAEVRYADGSPLLIEELTHPDQIGRPWIIFPKDSGFYL